MIKESRCHIRSGGRKTQLKPQGNNEGVALEGARALGFTFIGDLQNIPDDPERCTVDVLVKLIDGSKAHTKRKLATARIGP